MNHDTRIRTLLRIGFLPVEAVAIVDEVDARDGRPDTLDNGELETILTSSDVSALASAGVLVQYSQLIDDRYKGLWEARSIGSPSL